MMIYLVVETFRTECKGFIWHTEYIHTVKSFTNREDACNFIYNNYRKIREKKNVRSAEFSDCKYGAHSEYLFEDEVHKTRHRVFHTLQPIELEQKEVSLNVLEAW